MKYIPLSQFKKCKNKHLNLFAVVDDEDFDSLNKYRWQALKEKKSNNFYAVSNIKGKMVKMHRLIMGATNPYLLVDHKNMNGLDNRRCNLRFATHQQNAVNRKKFSHSKSKYKGVSLSKTKKKCVGEEAQYYYSWRARIRINGVKKSIGSYKTEEEAAVAYDKAAIKNFGEYAVLNFPTLLAETGTCERHQDSPPS